jgi:two-component system OmpR family response regulator
LNESAHILVVDDDPGILDVIAGSLGSHGFQVSTAQDARTMDSKLAAEHIDLVILDVLMPGENGLSACRRLARANRPPVIMLSAMDTSDDRVLGLDCGADYYLGKPCDPRELLAVVRATLRRKESLEPLVTLRSRVGFLGWTVDFSARELKNPFGVLVHLTDGEFVILRAFVERPRRVLTREQLLDAARGRDSDAFDRAIDVQVSRLRRKLKAPNDELIKTIRNEGYMFVPQTCSL